MAGSFDPYYEWFAIPADAQPPDHYRLLGIDLFEDDPDVISAMADQRVLLLRARGTDHPEAAKRLLREVSVASTCLLKPELKATYDAQLRTKPTKPGGQTAPASAAPAPARKVASSAPDAMGGIRVSARKGKRRPSNVTSWVVLGGLTVVLVAVIAVMAASRPSGDPGALGGSVASTDVDSAGLIPSGLEIVPIEDLVVDEHEQVELAIQLRGARPPDDAPIFSLVQSPKAMSVDAASGIVKWIPGEEEGGKNPEITARVAAGHLRGEVTFHVQVRETNQSPALAVIRDRTVEPGGVLEFRLKATDPDRPTQALTYHLIDGPSGAVVQSKTGDFVWNADAASADKSFTTIVEVRDSQQAVDRQQFTIHIGPATSIAMAEPNNAPTAGKPHDPPADAVTGSGKPAGSPDGANVGGGKQNKPQSGETAKASAVQPSESHDNRLPVPDDAEVDKAKQLLKELYQSTVEKAETPPARLALARQLIMELDDLSAEPAQAYALLEVVRALSVAGEDPDFAVDVVRRKSSMFAVDFFPEAVGLFADLTRRRTALGSRTVLAALDVAQEATNNDDFDSAEGLATIAARYAGKLDNPSVTRLAADRVREIKILRREYDRYARAREALAGDAKDAAASLTAGRWLSFIKEDWKRGLPLLAQSSSRSLSELARRDLSLQATANAPDTDAVAAIADGWHEEATQLSGKMQQATARRAMAFYNQALPKLEGLARVRVEKQIQEVLSLVEGATSKDDPPDFAPVVMDQKDVEFKTVGPWKSWAGGYAGSHIACEKGDGSGRALWTFTGLPIGRYEIAATWTRAANHATDATYRIYDGTAPAGGAVVNQEPEPKADYLVDMRPFAILGSARVTSGTLRIELSNKANEFVTADAVRIRRVGTR